MNKYYFLKVIGSEEKWISYSHWSSEYPEDDGFYLTGNKIRACLFSELVLTDSNTLKQLERFGKYELLLADDMEILRYKNRIYQ